MRKRRIIPEGTNLIIWLAQWSVWGRGSQSVSSNESLIGDISSCCYAGIVPALSCYNIVIYWSGFSIFCFSLKCCWRRKPFQQIKPLLWVSRLIFQVLLSVILLEITIGRKHFPSTLLPAELFLNFCFPPKVVGVICLVSSDCVALHPGRRCTTALMFFSFLKQILVQSQVIDKTSLLFFECFVNVIEQNGFFQGWIVSEPTFLIWSGSCYWSGFLLMSSFIFYFFF